MAGHDRLTPEGRKFFQQIEELKKLQVRIGYQDDGEEYDEATVLEVAAYNELGTVYVPERPFMRNSVDNHRDDITSACVSQLQAITQGETAEKVLKQLGVMQKGLIQREIREGTFTRLDDKTIARKGTNKALIDTGLMRQAVDYEIKPKGDD